MELGFPCCKYGCNLCQIILKEENMRCFKHNYFDCRFCQIDYSKKICSECGCYNCACVAVKTVEKEDNKMYCFKHRINNCSCNFVEEKSRENKMFCHKHGYNECMCKDAIAKSKLDKQRRFLPTLAETLDRLAICQQKEIYISEHRDEYTKEINDILHDIDLILEEEKPNIDANFLRNLIVLTQMNTWIWNNESNFRKGIKEGNNLELSHSLNSLRNNAKNKIQETVGGRKDYKLDNVTAHKQWIPSGYDK